MVKGSSVPETEAARLNCPGRESIGRALRQAQPDLWMQFKVVVEINNNYLVSKQLICL